jgi:hypothetical protein
MTPLSSAAAAPPAAVPLKSVTPDPAPQLPSPLELPAASAAAAPVAETHAVIDLTAAVKKKKKKKKGGPVDDVQGAVAALKRPELLKLPDLPALTPDQRTLLLSLFPRWPSSLMINLFGIELKVHWDALLGQAQSQAALHTSLVLLKENFFDDYLKAYSFLHGQNTEDPKQQEALACNIPFMSPQDFIACIGTVIQSIDREFDLKARFEMKAGTSAKTQEFLKRKLKEKADPLKAWLQLIALFFRMPQPRAFLLHPSEKYQECFTSKAPSTAASLGAFADFFSDLLSIANKKGRVGMNIEQFFHVTNGAKRYAKQPSPSALSRLENMYAALMALAANYTAHFGPALKRATEDPPLTHEAYCKENNITPQALQPQKDFVAQLLQQTHFVVFQACWGHELVEQARQLGTK